ncbi:MAG: glycogen synthase [Ignavibacteriales bacterium]|nr:glycogen synthase [Ignavibacteriales bacterium]
MKIVFAASEVFPYAKTGGLADVAGSLPVELSNLGHEVKVFMPKYNIFGEAEFGLRYNWNIGAIPIRVNNTVHSVHVHTTVIPGSNVEIYFVDCPYYFHRFRVYTNDHDEDERFIIFSKGIIEILQRIQWAPDIIHCNDWQTGLLPLMLRDNYGWDRMFDKTSTVFTIHNISYQGKFSKAAFHKAEIDHKHFLSSGIGEYDGGVNFLKTAIFSSDVINTVSETYAEELLLPEFGCGMESYLAERKDDFFGILNGIDYNIWNPGTDPHIPYHFSKDDLSGKIKNKKFLLEHLHLPFDENVPLIGIVSRMVPQKGFDIIGDVIHQLMELPAQWVILGGGMRKYEEMIQQIENNNPHKVAIYIGFNNELSHLIEAGTDIFLMPSHFEPCGLNQIYSLRYGTVPVVRKTGGLADTVQDWNETLAEGKETGTGYSFNDYTGKALLQSLQQAINDFKKKDMWKKIQINGMSKDYSWRCSAEKYVELYKHALQKII